MIQVPREADFPSTLRSSRVTSRVGVWLGICFAVAFLTGNFSHWAQSPDPWLAFPTRPVWGYRVSQGLHVIAGTAAIPLMLVKLWGVFHKFFARPERGWKAILVHLGERLSIAVLVASGLFMLATGLCNAAQWYPWEFSFRSSHYAVAWVAVGALVVHIALKAGLIKQAYAEPVDTDVPPDTAGPLTRRGLLRTTWLAVGTVTLATAGATITPLRKVSVFGTHSGDGPGGIPINRSAVQAAVDKSATGPDFRLELVHGTQTVQLRRSELEQLEQVSAELPISCVEGWSASGRWTGVRVATLLDLVDAPEDADIRVASLQQRGAFATTTLQANFARDDLTLLALKLEGEDLNLDHGFPCRLIAPNRPGVLQTKWVTRLEVL